MARVGFIGTGKIAASMVRGITGQGHEIYVSKRGANIAADLALLDDVQIFDNQDLLDKVDIIILCLLKDVAHLILPKLNFRESHRVISVMVDVSFSHLSKLCAPVQAIEITIPLPFVATGNCPLPCFPSNIIISELFGANNPIFSTKTEAGLNAHFAVTAMASVVFAQAETASKWLADLTEDTGAAEHYVLAMLGGFLIGLPKGGEGHINEALMALNTKGGLNQTLREHMEVNGTLNDLEEGMNGFRKRLGLPLKL